MKKKEKWNPGGTDLWRRQKKMSQKTFAVGVLQPSATGGSNTHITAWHTKIRQRRHCTQNTKSDLSEVFSYVCVLKKTDLKEEDPLSAAHSCFPKLFQGNHPTPPHTEWTRLSQRVRNDKQWFLISTARLDLTWLTFGTSSVSLFCFPESNPWV